MNITAQEGEQKFWELWGLFNIADLKLRCATAAAVWFDVGPTAAMVMGVVLHLLHDAVDAYKCTHLAA